jgi:hypothetical protein
VLTDFQQWPGIEDAEGHWAVDPCLPAVEVGTSHHQITLQIDADMDLNAVPPKASKASDAARRNNRR